MSRIGKILFFTTISIALVGIFVLYETSFYTAQLNIGDKYYFVKNQSIWVIVGIILCLVISRFDYKKLYNIALPLLLLSIGLLIVVFFPGIGVQLKGAHRWINLGLFVVQPSEFLKISLTLYLAAWLINEEKGRITAFLLLFFACIFLVVIEPDMGTAFIIAATSVFVYFLSGAKLRDMGIIFLILSLGVMGLIAVAPYRAARFAHFKEFDVHDLSTTSYHVKQILISLGSGGFNGVGFGKSIQKYAYLPEGTTDSIFALWAEEGGFLGSALLIGLYFFEIFLGFVIAARSPDKFGRLLAAGIVIFIGIQSLLNLGSQVVLIPLTGVPLPFMSYGGSSMLINFASIGVLLSIAKKI